MKESIFVYVPKDQRGPIQAAADCEGLTCSKWLLMLAANEIKRMTDKQAAKKGAKRP